MAQRLSLTGLLCMFWLASSSSLIVDERGELHPSMHTSIRPSIRRSTEGQLNRTEGQLNRTEGQLNRTRVIVVAENQHDMLDASLRCNANITGNILLITSPADVKTQEVARRHGAHVHLTDALHHEGAPFNKGRAIREVQMMLHSTPYMEGARILLTDNDICIPAEVWEKLPVPKPGELLTADRRCIFSTPENILQGRPSEIRHNPQQAPGYFQLYRSSPDAPLYPDNFPTADKSDYEYAKSFRRSQTDIGVVHFGAEHHWQGEPVDYISDSQHHGSSDVFASVIPPKPLRCPNHVDGVPDLMLENHV